MKAYLPEVGYGLALALAYFVWLVLEYAAGLQTTRISQHWILSNLYVVIPVLIIWRAIKHRRDVLEGGKLLWWQGLASGMIISVVAGAMRGPTWWFFRTYVNPGYFQAMIEYSVQTGMKREMAEAAYHPTIIAIESTLAPILLGIFLSFAATGFARWQVEKPETPAEVS